MKRGEAPEKKKKSGRSKLRKRQLRLRRRTAAVVALVAVIVISLAVNASPSIAMYVWLAAAVILLIEGLLLARRKALPSTLYMLIGALSVALLALGVAVRGYIMTDQGLTPREAMITELRVTDAWPAHINRYYGVESLDLRGSTVTDFTPILRMRNLRAIDARGNAAFDQEVYSAVSNALPNCEIQWSLPIAGQYYDNDISSVDLTDAGLNADEITALQEEYPDIAFDYTVQVMGKEVSPDATELDLQGASSIDPDELEAALSLLPDVTSVNLRGVPLTLPVVQALMNSNPDIDFTFTFAIPGGTMNADDETVTLPGGTYEDLQTAMAFMQYMPNLQYMDARAIVMNTAEQEALRADPRSDRVLYNFTVFSQSVNLLTTELNLDNNPIQSVDEAERILRTLPNLTRVSMLGCGLSQNDMMALADAHPAIHFIFTIKFGKYELRTDATAFTTNLYAGNDYHYTSKTFQPLKYCTDMMMLDIGHCEVTDISFIAGMKHLKVLILADNDIKDISVLSGLNELEYVELFLNKITDLTPLANKPSLLDLNIYYNQPKDLSPLATDTALERLWLGMCDLHSNQINAIQQALPNCKVNRKGSSSTGNGWRDHKRYAVIKEMYKTGSYIPFS